MNKDEGRKSYLLLGGNRNVDKMFGRVMLKLTLLTIFIFIVLYIILEVI